MGDLLVMAHSLAEAPNFATQLCDHQLESKPAHSVQNQSSLTYHPETMYGASN